MDSYTLSSHNPRSRPSLEEKTIDPPLKNFLHAIVNAKPQNLANNNCDIFGSKDQQRDESVNIPLDAVVPSTNSPAVLDDKNFESDLSTKKIQQHLTDLASLHDLDQNKLQNVSYVEWRDIQNNGSMNISKMFLQDILPPKLMNEDFKVPQLRKEQRKDTTANSKYEFPIKRRKHNPSLPDFSHTSLPRVTPSFSTKDASYGQIGDTLGEIRNEKQVTTQFTETPAKFIIFPPVEPVQPNTFSVSSKVNSERSYKPVGPILFPEQKNFAEKHQQPLFTPQQAREAQRQQDRPVVGSTPIYHGISMKGSYHQSSYPFPLHMVPDYRGAVPSAMMMANLGLDMFGSHMGNPAPFMGQQVPPMIPVYMPYVGMMSGFNYGGQDPCIMPSVEHGGHTGPFFISPEQMIHGGMAMDGHLNIHDKNVIYPRILPRTMGYYHQHQQVNMIKQKKPARFCHVCWRPSKSVAMATCSKILEGSCRKVVCQKCFVEFGWNWEEAISENSRWECTHCMDRCPKKAQCFTYQRTNQRRAMKKKESQVAGISDQDFDNQDYDENDEENGVEE